MNKKAVVSDSRVDKEELLRQAHNAVELIAINLPDYLNNTTSFIIELNVED